MSIRTAVIGKVVFDEIVLDDPLQEEATPGHLGFRFGGKAFNIATALSRLEQRVALVSVLGSDPVGDRARDLLTSRQIDQTGVRTCAADSGAAVPTPQVRLTEGRLRERWITFDSDPRIEDCYILNLRELAPIDCDVLIFTLEHRGRVLPEVARVVKEARNRNPGCLVVAQGGGAVDEPVNDEVFDLLGQADVINLNHYEAAFLMGRQAVRSPSHRLAEELRKRCGTGAVCITYGPAGWAWASADSAGSSMLFEVPTVDKIGVSDVFTAAMSVSLARGERIEQATTCGGRAAKISVGRTGGTERFPTPEELWGPVSR